MNEIEKTLEEEKIENVVLLKCVSGKNGLELRLIGDEEESSIRKPANFKLEENSILLVNELKPSKNNKYYTIPKIEEIFRGQDYTTIIESENKNQAVFDILRQRTLKNQKTLIEFDKYPCPTVEKNGFYVDAAVWKLLVRNFLRQKNTLIAGPTGCGKTELMFYLSECMSAKIHIEDMGALSDPIPGLLGTHRIENGNSIFDYAPMVNAIQEDNMLVLLDELNRCPPTANNILFPLLDSRRELPVSIADYKHSRNIKVKPSVAFFATANFGFEYSGTSEIDRALQDRLMVVELDYPPAEVETEILINRTGLNRTDSSRIVEIFNKIRKLHKNSELTTTVSTRSAIEVAELVSDEFTLTEALNFVILPLFTGDKADGEKSIILSVIISK